MIQEISLFTSINPNTTSIRGIVDSWTNNFAEIISINPIHEIRILKENFPKVRFIERTAYRNKHVKLDDIISLQLGETKYETVGIINSDIWTINIEKIDPSILSIARRTNIDSFSKIFNRKRFAWGFDFFSYPKSIIKNIPPSNMALGLPWWDYYLPFYLLQDFSVKAKFLDDSDFFHINHTQNWSGEDHGWLDREFQQQLGVEYQAMEIDTHRFGKMIYSFILESTI